MNFEMPVNKPNQEKPKSVEFFSKEILPKVKEMVDNPKLQETYLRMKIAEFKNTADELESKKLNDPKKFEALYDIISRAFPAHLDSVVRYNQTEEAFDANIDKLIKKTVENFRA